jgi:hypothetical protein
VTEVAIAVQVLNRMSGRGVPFDRATRIGPQQDRAKAARLVECERPAAGQFQPGDQGAGQRRPDPQRPVGGRGRDHRQVVRERQAVRLRPQQPGDPFERLQCVREGS